MKRLLALVLCLAGYASVLWAVEIKPVTGTFINLAYQDVRNKYTNPAGVDMTSPELWAAKVAEMSDMGILKAANTAKEMSICLSRLLNLRHLRLMFLIFCFIDYFLISKLFILSLLRHFI